MLDLMPAVCLTAPGDYTVQALSLALVPSRMVCVFFFLPNAVCMPIPLVYSISFDVNLPQACIVSTSANSRSIRRTDFLLAILPEIF